MTPMVADMAEGAMAAFLTEVGTFLTTAISWMGSVLDSVTSSPPLMVLVLAMPIAGFAVGLLSRLIRL